MARLETTGLGLIKLPLTLSDKNPWVALMTNSEKLGIIGPFADTWVRS
jgi:hypothetical protein